MGDKGVPNILQGTIGMIKCHRIGNFFVLKLEIRELKVSYMTYSISLIIIIKLANTLKIN